MVRASGENRRLTNRSRQPTKLERFARDNLHSPCSGGVRRHRSAGCDDPRDLRAARRIIGCRRAAAAVPRHCGQCAGATVRADNRWRVAAAQAATPGGAADLSRPADGPPPLPLTPIGASRCSGGGATILSSISSPQASSFLRTMLFNHLRFLVIELGQLAACATFSTQ